MEIRGSVLLYKRIQKKNLRITQVVWLSDPEEGKSILKCDLLAPLKKQEQQKKTHKIRKNVLRWEIVSQCASLSLTITQIMLLI